MIKVVLPVTAEKTCTLRLRGPPAYLQVIMGTKVNRTLFYHCAVILPKTGDETAIFILARKPRHCGMDAVQIRGFAN